MADPVARPVQRSPRQTLHHVWAPKLNRAVMLTGQEQLHLWVMLEAHPGVTRYCERPSLDDTHNPCPVADFWALRDGTPVWLRLEAEASGTAPNAVSAENPIVENVSADELKRHRHWIHNWLSLLPYLSSASPLSLRPLQAQVIELVGREASLDEIERHFANTDAVLVRTAVIAALHEGSLISEDLQNKHWDRSARVYRSYRNTFGHHHAPQ